MGKTLRWELQVCTQVDNARFKMVMKGIKPPPFSWRDCKSWLKVTEAKTHVGIKKILASERKRRRKTTVGTALRIYPIYPSRTIDQFVRKKR